MEEAVYEVLLSSRGTMPEACQLLVKCRSQASKTLYGTTTAEHDSLVRLDRFYSLPHPHPKQIVS